MNTHSLCMPLLNIMKPLRAPRFVQHCATNRCQLNVAQTGPSSIPLQCIYIRSRLATSNSAAREVIDLANSLSTGCKNTTRFYTSICLNPPARAIRLYNEI